jgi:phage shock protein C
MKKLTRSLTDRKIAGVCGGLGDYLSIDPTLVRLTAIFVGFFTGIVPGLITYIVGWIIIPDAAPARKK